MSSLATLTVSGRAAIASAIKSQTLHFALGSGDPAWDDDADKNHLKEILVHKTALENELGRRTVNAVGFVTPDPDGDVVIPLGRQSDGTIEQGRFRQVTEPTSYLFLRVNFDFDDASNQIVREVAVFMNTEVDPELPPGQRYFKPDQLAGRGHLLAIQRYDPPIHRSPATRESFEFVLAI